MDDKEEERIEAVNRYIMEAVQQFKIGRKRKAYSTLNQKRRKIFGVKINCETASNDHNPLKSRLKNVFLT